MAELSLPKFLHFPSSDKLEKLLFSTGKAGHTKDRNHDKHKYFLSLCRYSCTIPLWDQNETQFSEQYKQSLLNMTLVKASENGEFLKWSRLTTPVYAVAVPDDGQSLFHAVSIAMWGLQDKHSTVKQLMENAIPDMADSLKTRWQIHASDVKVKDRQLMWSDIFGRLVGISSIFTSLRKEEEIDSLAIFILANVLHRPIIVIDVQSYISSHVPERMSAGGIYLPLEKPAIECSKSPIILCHRDHHFSPLMFMSSVNGEVVFPLHEGDMSLLPVRYGLDHANTVAQIQQYLNIQEKDITSDSGSRITLLCSSVSIMPLPEHFNSINIHLRKCQEIFQDFVASRKKNDSEKVKVSVSPVGQRFGSHPFKYIDESNQTYVVPMKGSRRKDSSVPSLPQPFSSPPSLFANNVATSLSPISYEQICKNTQKSMMPRNITEPQREREGTDKKIKCLTPGCVNERDPGIGELCYSCFMKSTVNESGLQLMSLYEGGKQRYVFRQAYSCGTDDDQRQLSALHPRNESPLLENGGKTYPEMPFLSAMNETCKECSHYHCSEKTYPYCHECSKNVSEKPKANYPNQNVCSGLVSGNTVKKRSFPDVFLPPMNFKTLPGNSFDQIQSAKSKQVEKEDTEIAQHFCQSEGCQNLRQETSNFCLQCSCQKNTLENASSVPPIITKPIQQISSSGTRGSLEFGQVECLSHNSDEDVIEVSEAPVWKNDVHKCVSPVCEILLSSSQMLCDKCQKILISHSQQQHNRNEHPAGVRNDWENQQTLSAYRAGMFSGIIANSPSSPLKQLTKSHSEKIKSASDPNIGAWPKESFRDEDMSRMFGTVSHTSGTMSIGPNQNLTHAVAQVDPQPSSSFRVANDDFLRKYTQITNEHLRDITKCRSDMCQNYGNKIKYGYCNSCFSMLSEREMFSGIFGRTESDS